MPGAVSEGERQCVQGAPDVIHGRKQRGLRIQMSANSQPKVGDHGLRYLARALLPLPNHLAVLVAFHRSELFLCQIKSLTQESQDLAIHREGRSGDGQRNGFMQVVDSFVGGCRSPFGLDVGDTAFKENRPEAQFVVGVGVRKSVP